MVRDKNGRLVSGSVGRPKMSDSEKRRNRVQIMITDESMAALRELAERYNVSVSNLARAAIEDYIDRQNGRDDIWYDEY